MARNEEIRWLSRRIREHWPFYLLGSGCAFIGSLIALVDPLVMKWLIDGVLVPRRATLLPLVALAFLLSFTARLGLSSLSSAFYFRVVQKLAFDLRTELLRALQRQSLAYHERVKIGDLLFRMDSDVEVVGTLTVEIAGDIIRVIGMGMSIIVVMFWLNARLTLVVLPFIPLFIAVSRRFRRILRARADTVQAHQGKLTTFLQEHLANILQVQLLSAEEKEARRFIALSQDAVSRQFERKRAEVLYAFVISLVIASGASAVLGYGGYVVIIGGLSIGGLVAFYGYTLQLFGPFYGVADIYSKIQRLGASGARLMEIGTTHTGLVLCAEGVELTRHSTCDIALRGVIFGYDREDKVLDGVDLDLGSGARIALSGPNGSGKSTLAKVIARLYEVESGFVQIAGVDVRTLELKSLRRTVVYVAPAPMLRDASLRENVLDGTTAAGSDDLGKVADVARLNEIIGRLTEGWNEPLGPRARLSSGEQQRVALARALMMRPSVLILDECLSSIDEETERLILDDLRVGWPKMTIIAISHRPYVTKWADRVITVDSGKLLDAPVALTCLAVGEGQ